MLAVHPTQLYEAALMLGAFAILWRLRGSNRPIGWLFGVYLVFAGANDFLIEFVRAKDDRILRPLHDCPGSEHRLGRHRHCNRGPLAPGAMLEGGPYLERKPA